jgi:hypothetical protein
MILDTSADDWFNFLAASSFQLIGGKGFFHYSDLEEPAEFA